jgi:hypothetical protein
MDLQTKINVGRVDITYDFVKNACAKRDYDEKSIGV